jgi:hypothetical protein
MKNLVALLLLFQTASFGLAITMTEVNFLANSDSVETTNDVVPEHYPSKFNAEKLESATNTKYLGSGMMVAGTLMYSLGSNPGLGGIVAVIGGVVGFIGRIGQDVQLVRLGWKHERRLKQKNGSARVKSSSKVDCGNVGLNMGDNVSFNSSNDETLRGQIIGIMESAVGCQVIVRYEFDGEFKTSTLGPGSLTKL